MIIAWSNQVNEELQMEAPFGSPGLENAGLNADEICELIDETQWSLEFSHKQIEIIAQFMGAYIVKKKQVVFQEGQQESYMCLLIRGRVSVIKKSEKKNLKRITTLGSGQTFGEMSLIDGEPRSASVVAVEDTMLLILTKSNFDTLRHQYSRIGVKLLYKLAQLLSARLRQTSGALVECLVKINT
jgi:CRP/FNR family transcriptional regulator, cyclic AMP receptor protein